MKFGAKKGLMMLNKACIGAFLGIALLSFVIGWVFPVEGPLDSTYDDFIKVFRQTEYFEKEYLSFDEMQERRDKIKEIIKALYEGQV